jgi:hypothetical protein
VNEINDLRMLSDSTIKGRYERRSCVVESNQTTDGCCLPGAPCKILEL